MNEVYLSWYAGTGNKMRFFSKEKSGVASATDLKTTSLCCKELRAGVVGALYGVNGEELNNADGVRADADEDA
jgi:hypothetical protein